MQKTHNNQITNIGTLVNMTGLGNKDILRIMDNPLDAISKDTYIPALEGRGVIIK